MCRLPRSPARLDGSITRALRFPGRQHVLGPSCRVAALPRPSTDLGPVSRGAATLRRDSLACPGTPLPPGLSGGRLLSRRNACAGCDLVSGGTVTHPTHKVGDANLFKPQALSRLESFPIEE